MAAACRAAHLIVDRAPHIFADTVAERLLGSRADELISYHRAHGDHVVLAGARAQVTVRAAVTEARLADAAERGTNQYVILGAGLDTFAYRSPVAARVRVFEVDQPATQYWKRDRLATDGIESRGTVHYVPLDFEAGALVPALVAAGFDVTRPAFVSWLGVTMYLSGSAIDGTLQTLGSLAPGSEIVADYMLPEGDRDAAGETYASMVAPVAAEHGEPWLSCLAPDDVTTRLAAAGFTEVEHVEQANAVDAALWRRDDALRPARLSMLVHATVAR